MLGESLFSQYRHNSFLFLVVVGLSIVNIGIFLYQTYLAFTVPARFGYVEPYVVYHGTHWEMLYAPIAEPPYIQTVFPPVYLILTGIVDAVFNSPLFSGRLISFVSTVSTAVIISLIVYRSSSGKKDTAALAGVIYISSPYVTSSGVIASPDNLGIAISVAALYWFLTREGYGKIIASAVACALALLTKQSLIGAPAAIFFSLIYKKEFKKAAVFFTLVSLIGFCVLATLNYVTNGRAWFHIVEYNTHNLSAALLIETTYFFITLRCIVDSSNEDILLYYSAHSNTDSSISRRGILF
ncbi:MAG: ArnT family glycosyltransferase [Candidatus Paceibacteria bacterium]